MTRSGFRSFRLGGLVVAIGLIASASPLIAEDFYEQQLHQGKADLAAGRAVQAADELRIAAFGFLDRPTLLAEALVRLTMAQNALSQTSAVTQTLNRFVDVERRFDGYATASLEPQTRAAFEALLLKGVPRADLNAIPALARFVRSEAAKVSDLPAEKRSAAYEAGFRRASRDIDWPLSAARDAASRGLDDEVLRWGKRALSIEPSNEAARVLVVRANAHRGDCREVLARIAELPATVLQSHAELAGDQVVCLVKQSRWNEAEPAAAKLPESERSRADVVRALQTIAARHPTPLSRPATSTQAAANNPGPSPSVTKSDPPDPTKTVRSTPSPKSADALAASKALVNSGRFLDAARLLEPASAADPTNRDLRLALLEAAALAREWQTAVLQVPAAIPFKSGEEASMFYAAAALYERGRKVEARQMLERARPRLPSTPLVDYYSRLILGSPPK